MLANWNTRNLIWVNGSIEVKHFTNCVFHKSLFYYQITGSMSTECAESLLFLKFELPNSLALAILNLLTNASPFAD